MPFLAANRANFTGLIPAASSNVQFLRGDHRASVVAAERGSESFAADVTRVAAAFFHMLEYGERDLQTILNR